MSEVKRYRAPVLHHDTGWMKSYGWQVVMASDFDAAQDELAALREELAETQRISQQEELRANEYDTKLVAAEQRNATLIHALLKIIQMNRQHAEDQYGDAEKAESWSCITVARDALESGNAEK